MADYESIDEVTLRVVVGPGTGRRIRVSNGGIILGRTVGGPGAMPADQLVSSKHAEIRWDANGVLFIRDLGSKNGTFVNGDRVDEWDLNPRDRIGIGLTVLEVSGATPTPTAPTAASQISQSASGHGANVGGPNYGVIDTHSEDHQWDVTVEDELSWWTRARGPARIVVILGIVLALAGFGFFAYPIVSGFGGTDAAQRARQECNERFPEFGQDLAECLLRASQQGPGPGANMSPWIQIGGGLFFTGAVFMIVARLLPGANPEPTRRKRR